MNKIYVTYMSNDRDIMGVLVLAGGAYYKKQ